MDRMEQFLLQIIKEAGHTARGYFTKGVTRQAKTNLGDLLTEADTAVEQLLIDSIAARYPSHHIHSEERSEDINPGAEFEWVIDPIDGTRNFALGIPFWCHLIAVMRNGQPYLAAVYNPIADELFFAAKGKGAFLNGRPIRINNTASFDFCFACIVRNTANDIGGFKNMHLRFINETTGWIHNFGNMLSACHLAQGSVDFFAMNCGFDHDYLAPVLICSEAGAVVTDSAGNPWQRGQRDLVIANPILHSKVLELFKE